MSKEKIDWLQHMLFFVEGLALFSGILVWRNMRQKRHRFFVLYLLFIVLGELTAHTFSHYGMRKISVRLYDYLIVPVEFLFLFWFYREELKGKWARILPLVFMTVSLLVRFVEFTLLKNEKFSFSSLSYVISTLFLVVLVVIYLRQFIQSDNIIHYNRHLAFWVSVALLFFYLGTFPLFTFFNYLYGSEKKFFYIYWEVQMYLNMLMYLLFSGGLLWTNLKR